MYASSSSNIETIDTPDVSVLLTQINDNFNILIYLFSICIGLVFAFAICFAMFKIIKWCLM